MIKICYLAHYTGGGSAISLQTLVNNLDRTVFAPVVVFHRVKNKKLVEALQAQDIPVFSLIEPQEADQSDSIHLNVTDWLANSPSGRGLLGAYQLTRAGREFIREDLKLFRPLTRWLRTHEVDLIHLNNGLRQHRMDLLISRWLNIPTVCHVRNFQLLTSLERFAGQHVKRFFYISKMIAADYERQKIAPERGQVIHNAAPVPPPLPTADKAAIRAEFGLDSSHFVVVNVGRLVSWKGQDVFLQALTYLTSAMPHLRALIVGAADENEGSQAYAQSLQKLVEVYRLEDKVIFTGFRADATRLMAAADVVVHSATTPEPFGRVIIEGMSTGVPVVGSHDGGVADIITSEINGLLFKPGNEEELAVAIKKLAANPILSVKLGQAGRQHVAEYFSVARHVRCIEQVYLACLSQDKKSQLSLE